MRNSTECLLDAVETCFGVVAGSRVVLLGAQRCVAIGQEADFTSNDPNAASSSGSPATTSADGATLSLDPPMR